jgi:outer membrane biosynthesis protein TonB
MKPISNSYPNHPVGTVLAWPIIDSSGNVRYSRIVRGLGTLEDAQAITASREWKFEPATMKGSKVAIQTILEVKFQ